MNGTIKDPTLKYIKYLIAQRFSVYAGKVARFQGHWVIFGTEGVYSLSTQLHEELEPEEPLYTIELEEIEEL